MHLLADYIISAKIKHSLAKNISLLSHYTTEALKRRKNTKEKYKNKNFKLSFPLFFVEYKFAQTFLCCIMQVVIGKVLLSVVRKERSKKYM